jgi:predicted nucleic acid-binding protein
MILDLVSNFSVAEILQPSVMKAIDLSILYGYSYWDSLILATAIDNGCSILYTEDMQDGQVVDGKLKIVNPFTMKQ